MRFTNLAKTVYKVSGQVGEAARGYRGTDTGSDQAKTVYKVSGRVGEAARGYRGTDTGSDQGGKKWRQISGAGRRNYLIIGVGTENLAADISGSGGSP